MAHTVSDRLAAAVVQAKLSGDWRNAGIGPCSYCKDLATNKGWTLRYCNAGERYHITHNQQGSHYFKKDDFKWPTS